VFPDDEKESNPTSFKFLQIAHAWKEAQKKKEAEGPLPSSTKHPRVAEDDDMDEDDGDDDGNPRMNDEERSSGDES
jgi:crooked neck